MKKYALGVHHLNIAYCSGNLSSYHRQVRESIAPVFNLLEAHPGWCFTIELCGFSIEFIATHYPDVMCQFKALADRGQIELISVTYAPQIWIAFPKRDLIRSIEINQRLLERYGLRECGVFFCQENFCGPGIESLGKWFDVAVVKDDYYYHFYDHPEPLTSLSPYYTLGSMKIIIAWGHILESVASQLFQNNEFGNNFNILAEHYDVLSKANDRFEANVFSNFVGHTETVEWQWYHTGSSERFSKPLIHPEDFSTCRFNPGWSHLIEKQLLSIESKGYKLSGIRAFLDELDGVIAAKQCEPLLEGGWNMAASEGSFIWMGLNGKDHEDALSVRNHNWLSRSRLFGLECLLDILNIGDVSGHDLRALTDQAWTYQFLAEASDATGWFPEPSEVADSIYHSDLVLDLVASVVSSLRTMHPHGPFIIDTRERKLLPEWAPPILQRIEENALFGPPPTCEGMDHRTHFYRINDRQHEIIIDFVPYDKKCSVSFPFHLEVLAYNPVLHENSMIKIRLDTLHTNVIYLPLPNGLIMLNEGSYIIKHNELMNIACCIDKKARTVCFKVINPKQKKTRWRLTMFKGTEKEAMELAAGINTHPVVFL